MLDWLYLIESLRVLSIEVRIFFYPLLLNFQWIHNDVQDQPLVVSDLRFWKEVVRFVYLFFPTTRNLLLYSMKSMEDFAKDKQ